MASISLIGTPDLPAMSDYQENENENSSISEDSEDSESSQSLSNSKTSRRSLVKKSGILVIPPLEADKMEETREKEPPKIVKIPKRVDYWQKMKQAVYAVNNFRSTSDLYKGW